LIERKIKSFGQLKKTISLLKSKGKRIVFTNGCFDILHYGHAKYLEEAKKKGDILVVAVNSDSSVRRLKGSRRPVVRERERALLVSALESVDFVTVFSEATPIKLITSLKPDVLVKGSDWNGGNIVGKEFVESYHGRVLTIPYVSGLSSSNLIKKIAKKF
jgi:D-beta-D-heptose 7-phosphate kinase/D-beta-D-heptose 1-phosphate adenosyltransferase